MTFMTKDDTRLTTGHNKHKCQTLPVYLPTGILIIWIILTSNNIYDNKHFKQQNPQTVKITKAHLVTYFDLNKDLIPRLWVNVSMSITPSEMADPLIKSRKPAGRVDYFGWIRTTMIMTITDWATFSLESRDLKDRWLPTEIWQIQPSLTLESNPRTSNLLLQFLSL